MPVDAIGYLPKLIRYACVEIGGPVTMNGRFYVSDEDIVHRAAFLRILWEKLVDAISYWVWMEGPARTKYLMMVRNGLLIAFDNAYVEFEKAYVSFMIAVEESCKSILSYGNSLVAKFRNGNTEAHEDFVKLLQKMYNINPEANSDGKNLQDFDSSIYINAKKMLQAGILPAMCGRVHGSLFDPGGGLGRQEVQESAGRPNFGGLVLDCIEADFWKQNVLVLTLFSLDRLKSSPTYPNSQRRSVNRTFSCLTSSKQNVGFSDFLD